MVAAGASDRLSILKTASSLLPPVHIYLCFAYLGSPSFYSSGEDQLLMCGICGKSFSRHSSSGFAIELCNKRSVEVIFTFYNIIKTEEGL